MPTYIAMLRGINVGGHKAVNMEQLRGSFASLGFGDVQTYIQSGNVVFQISKVASGLAAAIENKILRDFGFTAPVLLKTAGELSNVVKRNPFAKDKAIDQSKLHVTFLSSDPPKTALELLQPLAAGPERICIAGRDVYLYCPNGYGRTKLHNTAIEKKLSCGATTRNWNTTKTLLAMAEMIGKPSVQN